MKFLFRLVSVALMLGSYSSVQLHAQQHHIKSKVIKLSKKSIKNKNLRFKWDSKKKQIQIKRKTKTLQYINFGVLPKGIELIDVNFDGYADVVVHIREDETGKYVENGNFLHIFYYIYDKKKRKFVYHKGLTELIYGSTENYNGEMKGFQFDAKNKILVLGDKERFFYGVKIYTLKDRKLHIKKKEFRLFPAYYPDGVDIEYTYKKDKIKRIEFFKDGDAKTRKRGTIQVTDKKYVSKDGNATSKKKILEKLLLKNIYKAFTNHQFHTFVDKHLYYKESRSAETALMDTVIMLDNVFKKDGARQRNDRLFELLQIYASIKDLKIENFIFDKNQSMYTLDVALQLKNKILRYRWHFYIDKLENGIYFLPLSYDNKTKIYTLLNDNYTFDDVEMNGVRVSNVGRELRISTPWIWNGQEQWHQSYEKCSSKYIEFGLNDYTGNGHIDWFNTCTNSFVNKRESRHVIRFGGKYQFHSMIQSVTASKYIWHEKKKRFIFASTWGGGSYQVCEPYVDDKKEKIITCEKYYTDYQVKNSFKVGNKYINKKLFEASLEKDELYFGDSRRKVKKGTLLYLYRRDIGKNKPYAMLKEDTLVMPTGKVVPYWENNVTLLKPLKFDGIHYYKIDKYIKRVVLDENDTIPWNPKFGKPKPTHIYAIVYYKNNECYMDIKNYKEK